MNTMDQTIVTTPRAQQPCHATIHHGHHTSWARLCRVPKLWAWSSFAPCSSVRLSSSGQGRQYIRLGTPRVLNQCQLTDLSHRRKSSQIRHQS